MSETKAVTTPNVSSLVEVLSSSFTMLLCSIGFDTMPGNSSNMITNNSVAQNMQ